HRFKSCPRNQHKTQKPSDGENHGGLFGVLVPAPQIPENMLRNTSHAEGCWLCNGQCKDADDGNLQRAACGAFVTPTKRS
ncbi:hypothetical protein, partial [Microvirga zambiensis]|uniref:hypothetical protein n=1 Tax=Microvirga zambiensis TaxID=1402137 RepID=UPI001AEFA752